MLMQKAELTAIRVFRNIVFYAHLKAALPCAKGITYFLPYTLAQGEEALLLCGLLLFRVNKGFSTVNAAYCRLFKQEYSP